MYLSCRLVELEWIITQEIKLMRLSIRHRIEKGLVIILYLKFYHKGD